MKPCSKSPNYLIRNPYSYCFRINVPADLQRVVGKKELRYSLKTGYLSEAKYKARILAGQVQRIFQHLRKGGVLLSQLSDAQIQKLVTQYIKRSLENLDNYFYPADDDKYLPYASAEEFFDSVEWLDDIRETLIAKLNVGDYSMLENVIGGLLQKNEICDVDKNSKAYQKLCVEMHKAESQLIPIQKKHMICDFSYQKELSEIFPQLSKDLPQIESKTSERLSAVAQAYWNEKQTNWKPRTKTDYKTCYNHLLKALGTDTQIHTITYQTAREYKALLMEMKNKQGKPLSASRTNIYLGFAKAIFNFARRNGYVDINPFEGQQISEKSKRVDELRDVFDKEDLEKIFCLSIEYKEDMHKHPHNFWVPLLGLYTGCRLEEICQLYCDDIIQKEGIWCLNIVEDKPDKSVKTGEKRLVPLHPLISEELNFANGYVKKLKDKKGRVFPDLKRTNNRYGHNLGQWFGRFIRRCGIVAPPRTKVFHSFRHTVANHLKQKDITDQYIAELLGHTIQNITMSRYGKRYEPKKLYETAVTNLDYGIDLSHLKDSKFVTR